MARLTSLFSFMTLVAIGACGGKPATGSAQGTENAALPFKITAMSSFNEPWAMTFLPGSGVPMTDRALVTEKRGKLFLFDSKANKVTEVTGAPKVAYGGQGGLGDVVAHPGFAGNRLVYLSWAEAGADGISAVVGRAKLRLDGRPRLQGLSIIWRQNEKSSGRGHFGHRIAFGSDGKLYLSSGERQRFEPAQDMASNLGKIVRLNDDGTIPRDNPFAGKGGVSAQIWSLGHRNPLGLAFDGAGRLWTSEMGPKGGDELNLAVRGGNFGYPKVSNGDHYDGRTIPDHKAGDGFAPPKIWWNPSISPSSLMIYSGRLFPQWAGDAFIGALSGQALIRIDLDGDKARKADQWDLKTRIREVEQGPDDTIWLLEDGEDGQLMKLTPRALDY